MLVASMLVLLSLSLSLRAPVPGWLSRTLTLTHRTLDQAGRGSARKVERLALQMPGTTRVCSLLRAQAGRRCGAGLRACDAHSAAAWALGRAAATTLERWH